MVSRLLYSFKINDVEILDYVLQGTKITEDRRNLSGNYAEIHLDSSVTDVLTITNGQTVEISRGVAASTEDVRFLGHVKQINFQGNRYIITCTDKLQTLKHKIFTTSYDVNIDSEAGEVSAIFSDIVTNGGLTASVEDSGTDTGDVVLDKFISRGNNRLNRLNVLAKILGWYFKYDYNNDWVRFEPKGFTTYATALTVGSNVFNVPKWIENIENMRNKITVNGAFDVDTRSETETGDGVTATYTLTNTPVSTKLTVDGVLQTLGVTGGSTTFDYTVDTVGKTYTFETGSIPGAVEIIMEYTTKVPRPVTGQASDSISKYGLTQEDEYTFDDIVTVNDAEKRMNQLLQLLKDGSTTTFLLTDEYTVKIGQKVNVVDSNSPSYSGAYIVQKITVNYPEPIDSITIGTDEVDINEILQTIEERLKALEALDTGDTGLIRTVIGLNKTLTITRDSFTTTKSKVCDSFIIGHRINGVIGISTALDSFLTGNSGNWSGSNLTVSDESTIKLVGANSMKLVWAGDAATGLLTSTQSFGDISSYTGASSGTPTKGTVGLWVYITTATDITSITLRLGSSSSDYTEVAATSYSSVNGYENWGDLTLSLQAGWNYLLFDMDGGSETGTPDWTACDYTRFSIVFPANTTIYFDYFTISQSNYIAANGFGSRKMGV